MEGSIDDEGVEVVKVGEGGFTAAGVGFMEGAVHGARGGGGCAEVGFAWGEFDRVLALGAVFGGVWKSS
jgi:hypothetical protein